MITREQQGRLVLEACTGMHGGAAKELCDAHNRAVAVTYKAAP